MSTVTKAADIPAGRWGEVSNWWDKKPASEKERILQEAGVAPGQPHSQAIWAAYVAAGEPNKKTIKGWTQVSEKRWVKADQTAPSIKVAAKDLKDGDFVVGKGTVTAVQVMGGSARVSFDDGRSWDWPEAYQLYVKR